MSTLPPSASAPTPGPAKRRKRALAAPLSPAAFRARIHVRVSVVYWLTLGGLFVWTALVAYGNFPDAPRLNVRPFLIVLVLAAINLGLRSWERLRRARRVEQSGNDSSSAWGWVFVTVDMLLIAAGLQATGGFYSPLWVVVFLVGGAETILARPIEAYLIRYGAILALLLGTLPLPLHTVTVSYYLEMAVRIGCFVAVSSVTRRLRETNDSKERENAALRAELGLIEERSHLSREIHDGVGNSLAAAVLRLEFAARSLEKSLEKRSPSAAPDETVALLKDEAQALRDAMRAVRDWTFFARPWPSSDADGQNAELPSARLETEVDRLSRRTGLAMHIEGAAHLDVLLPTARLALVRIVQEALTNAAKHAQGASRATVTLRRDGAYLLLAISDDGPGIADTVGAGVGMTSMRERATGLGGTLTVESAPGQGTSLTARIPVG